MDICWNAAKCSGAPATLSPPWTHWIERVHLFRGIRRNTQRGMSLKRTTVVRVLLALLVGNTWRKRIEKKLLMQFLDVGYIPVLRLPSFSSTFVTQGPNTVRTNLVGSYEPSRWRTAADRGPRHFCLHSSVMRHSGARQNALCRRAVDAAPSANPREKRKEKAKKQTSGSWFLWFPNTLVVGVFFWRGKERWSLESLADQRQSVWVGERV